MLELCCYLVLKLRKKNNFKVVIFGLDRSGSTLLESLICSTGYFEKHGEILNMRYGEVKNPAKYVMGRARFSRKSSFICHVKIYHLTTDRKNPVDPQDFIKSLIDDGWKIIYLNCRNKVKQTLSNQVAKLRGSYQKFDDSKEQYKIIVDCQKFVQQVQYRYEYDEQEQKCLSEVKHNTVIYEDDLENGQNHQKTGDEILDFLSLEHRAAQTKHRKVNTQKTSDLV